MAETKPKIEILPSEQIVKAAAAPVDVTDDQGRIITLRKPAPLANLDFAKAAGGAEINQLYLAEVAHLKYVGAIDGDIVPTPSTEPQLRALYVRLGESGNAAAQRGVFEHFFSQANGATAEEAVKNS